MKNIFVQNTYNKFINNIKYSTIEDKKFYIDTVNNNLYKLYYHFKILDFIFSSSSLNDEIISFINDKSISNTNIYVYHDIYNEYLIGIMPQCKHIVQENKVINNTIPFSNNIINTKLYYTNPNINKKNRIIVFLENQNTIPTSIQERLYPNQNNILMFNSISIQNDQNIGFLSELNRSEILQQSEYFVVDNDYYALEAKLCGCKLLDINNIDEDITNNYNISNIIDYNTYLGNLLI